MPKGIIFTGGPNSVYEEGAPSVDKEIFELEIPVLGICYGMQLMAEILGGKVARAEQQEYGKVQLTVEKDDKLFKGVESGSTCWMSHFDYVEASPEGFEITATTANCPVGGFRNVAKNLYGDRKSVV